MPTTASRTFTIAGLQPVYDPERARMIAVKLPASVTYVKGEILGEVKGANEVQILTPGGTISGGTWTITFGGQTTSALAFNATAATVQAALELLSTIGAGNVAVTGGPISSGVMTLTFQNDLGYTNVAQVTVGTGSLTGTAPTLTPSTTTAGTSGTPGTWKKYSSASTDGSQTAPFGLLMYDAITDASGNITLGDTAGGGADGETFVSVPMYFNGDFRASEIPSLTEAIMALTGWRMIHGTVAANGVLRLP